jgi:hypothetical protein
MVGLTVVINLTWDPAVKGLAAAEANLHGGILSLNVGGQSFCVELLVLVSITY